MSNITKEGLQKWNNYLNESGLSRVWRHVKDHDTAFISAERNDPNDKSTCIGRPSPQMNNKRRQRDLKAALLARQYGVTAVSGNYVENFGTPQAVEVAENSFFVVNINDDEMFLSEIEKLGEYFCQDSVLLVPHGLNGYLLGTSNATFPGYGAKIDVGRPVFGEDGEFLTRVNNRPLVFKETLHVYESLSRLERMAVKAIDSKLKL